LKIVTAALLAFALLLLLVWALLPRPIVDFEVEAEAGQPAKVRNHTQLDAIVVFGATTYDWRFEQGAPPASVDFEPGVVWTAPADREVSLSAMQAACADQGRAGQARGTAASYPASRRKRYRGQAASDSGQARG
jgi:hypothetical protein